MILAEILTRGESHRCRKCAGKLSIRHGAHRNYKPTPEYKAWMSMRQRCSNPKNASYDRYGGRGITVCPEWESFEQFYADMGDRPSPDHSLDRIDSEGHYCPENCRWATIKEQNINRCTTVILEHDGQRLNLEEWAEVTGLRKNTIVDRLRRGWRVEDALTLPAVKTGRPKVAA